MRRAISFCVPMASVDTIAPFEVETAWWPAPVPPRWRKPKPDAARLSRPATSSSRAASCRPPRSPPALRRATRRRATRRPRPQNRAAASACLASETPCARSGPPGRRRRRAETRAAAPTPRSHPPPPLPSRPLQRPRPASRHGVILPRLIEFNLVNQPLASRGDFALRLMRDRIATARVLRFILARRARTGR